MSKTNDQEVTSQMIAAIHKAFESNGDVTRKPKYGEVRFKLYLLYEAGICKSETIGLLIKE